jgi:hypothetical protein
MILTSRIEWTFTLGALASTLHVLFYRQHVLAIPAQYRFFVSSRARPNVRFVRLTCVVAADAGVEFVAAKVLDGNDVEG